MNLDMEEGLALAGEVNGFIGQNPLKKDTGVVLCTPFIHLSAVSSVLTAERLETGAQNCNEHKSGAYTGEVSTDMLKDATCSHVIIGHSERRQYFGETDDTVNRRTKAAVAAGLVAVVCVGEMLSEREANITNQVVGRQVREGLAGLTAADMEKIVIAYEPVWAIGTGKVATDEQAQEVHAFIRATLADIFGAGVAEATRIPYGGSMKPSNAAGHLAQKDSDSGLIGGAALKAEDFVGIIKAAIA